MTAIDFTKHNQLAARAETEVNKAQANLDRLIAAVVEHQGVSVAKATDLVLKTPEGASAYAKVAEASKLDAIAKNKPGVNPRLTAGLEAELDSLTDRYAKVHSLGPSEARKAALESERGREIYARIEAIRGGTGAAHMAELVKRGEPARSTGAKAELDAVIKRHADAHLVDIATATAAVTATDEGSTLYRRAYLETLGAKK